MQSAVRQWLGQQPASFFAKDIQKLVYRLDKCLNKFGQYVEKQNIDVRHLNRFIAERVHFSGIITRSGV